MVVAEPKELIGEDDPATWSHVRVATKYPAITQRYFATRGVQAECIKLSGAIELAPGMSLCQRIVDLVSSGDTLKANGLVEVEQIMSITSRLAVNRAAWKTRPLEINFWIQRFRDAVDAKAA
jgi:ATP phosphoribosyltransferase